MLDTRVGNGVVNGEMVTLLSVLFPVIVDSVINVIGVGFGNWFEGICPPVFGEGSCFVDEVAEEVDRNPSVATSVMISHIVEVGAVRESFR